MAKWRYFGSKNHCFYKIEKGTRLKTVLFSQYTFSFRININLTETGGTLAFQIDYFIDMLKIPEKGIFCVQANAHHKFGMSVLLKMNKKCNFMIIRPYCLHKTQTGGR